MSLELIVILIILDTKYRCKDYLEEGSKSVIEVLYYNIEIVIEVIIVNIILREI